MSRLTDELYAYIREKNEAVGLGEICKDERFTDEDRRDISAALRSLGAKNMVFRSVRDGKAYYSSDASKGEAVNPTKAFIAGTAASLNGFVNRSGGATDINIGADSNPMSGLLSALDKLSDLTRQMVGEENIIKGNASSYIKEVTFNEGRKIEEDGYSFIVPDGFKVVTGEEAKENYGENRDFMAYLPNHLYGDEEDDGENGLIKFYPGTEFPFVTINHEDMKAYFPELVDYMFKYEQSFSAAQMASMYGDAYPIKTGNGIAWASYMDSSTPDHSGGYHFFYINVPIKDKGRMFRVDVSDMAAENVFDAKKIAFAIMEHFCSEKKLTEYRRLDDPYYTQSLLDKTKADEWKAMAEELSKNVIILQNLGTESMKKLIEIDAKHGNINTDQATVLREYKKHSRDFLKDEAIVLAQYYDQVKSFFDKASETNKDNDLIYELQDYINEYLDGWKDISVTLGEDGEKIVETIRNFDETKAAVNNPILEERKQKQKALEEEKKKEETYQKALTLFEKNDFKSLKEGIALLEGLGEYKDSVSIASEKKQQLNSMDVMDRFAYAASKISEALKEDDKNYVNPYPETLEDVDRITEGWIRDKKKLEKEQDDAYDNDTGYLQRRMYSGSFTGLFDSDLMYLVNQMKSVMETNKREKEKLMDEIKRNFDQIKEKNFSKRSLKRLIDYYKEVYNDGKGYNFAVNGYSYFDLKISSVYKTRMNMMEEALRDLPKDPSSQREIDENNTWKKIVKFVDAKQEEMKKAGNALIEKQRKAAALSKEIIDAKKELEEKKASLESDTQKVKDECQAKRNEINKKIQDHKEEKARLEDSLKNTEKELEATFALNFSRKKELKAKIEETKGKISYEESRIPLCEEELAEVDKNEAQRIKALNDAISSLENKIPTLSSQVEKTEKEKTDAQELESKAMDAFNAADKVKKNFHNLYLIKKYGKQYGFEEEAKELAGSVLDYDKMTSQSVSNTNNYSQYSYGSNDKDNDDRFPINRIQVQNEAIKDEIMEVLYSASEPMTASQIADALKNKYSIDKISAMLSQLKEDNMIVREVIKRKAYFSIA